MAIYIHNNYKNLATYRLGGAYTIVPSAQRKNFVGVSGGTTTTPPEYFTFVKACNTNTSVNGGGAVLFSSSTATLTNENTCPDLLNNLSFASDNGSWTMEDFGKSTGTYTITNNNESEITINKVAVYTDTSNSSITSNPAVWYLLFVVDLENPLTLSAGATGTVSFTMDFSNI